MRVAVIGAGLAGLAAAAELARTGVQVVVFEKSRGVGGRLATRRLDDGLTANHGAPAIDAPAGSALAAALDGVPATVARVDGDGPAGLRMDHAVLPDGGVTAFAKHVAQDIEVVRSVRIARLRPVGAGYELGDEQGNGHGSFGAVIVGAPAPQAADLLATVPDEDERVARLRAVEYDPAVMVIGEAACRLPQAVIAAGGGPIQRVAVTPHPDGGRASVVAHLQTPLAARLLDDAGDGDVIREIADDPLTQSLVGAPVVWTMVKRWRYSTVRPGTHDQTLAVPERGIVMCGDSVTGSDMDAVWRSGLRAAAAITG